MQLLRQKELFTTIVVQWNSSPSNETGTSYGYTKRQVAFCFSLASVEDTFPVHSRKETPFIAKRRLDQSHGTQVIPKDDELQE